MDTLHYLKTWKINILCCKKKCEFINSSCIFKWTLSPFLFILAPKTFSTSFNAWINYGLTDCHLLPRHIMSWKSNFTWTVVVVIPRIGCTTHDQRLWFCNDNFTVDLIWHAVTWCLWFEPCTRPVAKYLFSTSLSCYIDQGAI